MLDNLRQDCCRIHKNSSLQPEQIGLGCIVLESLRNAGFRAVVFYRMGHWFRLHKMGFAAVVVERLMHHLCHCWISTSVNIGPGFVIAHVCGIVVDGEVGPIGKNCTIRQNVTIGGNYGKSKDGRTQPQIGDTVSIGPGAAILGPIAIGSNTIIGANALVTHSVPDNSVVGAFRAEVIADRLPDGTIRHFDKKMFISRREMYGRIEEIEDFIHNPEKKDTSDNLEAKK